MQVGSVLEEGSRKLNDSVVVFDVVDVEFEKFIAVFVKFFCPGNIDEGKQGSTHTTHDFVLLIESHLVILCSDNNFFYF